MKKFLKRRVLWINTKLDEIEQHVVLLQQENYKVVTNTNGENAISQLEFNDYDVVIIDAVFAKSIKEIRELSPITPIILTAESHQRHTIDEAIQNRIDNLLVKPINPEQIVTSLAFLLDYEIVNQNYTVQQYVADFNKRRFARQIDPSSWQNWVDQHVKMTAWDLRLDELDNPKDLRESHALERRECNAEFSNFVEVNYLNWIAGHNSPPLSIDVLDKFVFPEIRVGKEVFFLLLDCMRLDQWLLIEPLLQPYFYIDRQFYFSILPTATNYTRNAIFSGLFPLDLSERYPDLWIEADSEGTSVNRYERDLMNLHLERYGLDLKPSPHYFKIFDRRGEMEYFRWVQNLNHLSFAALVVDTIDMITHRRSEQDLLKQMTPHEEAFRSFVGLWFKHSPIFEILKLMADRGVTVVITTDHGSIECNRAAKVNSGRSINSGLRYKLGYQLGCDRDHGLVIDDPEAYMLPDDIDGKNYIIAKEDHYFVYRNHFKDYKCQLQGGLQHGGISMEEMILPCAILDPR